MLDKNILPIAMAQGLDTKADPKQLQPGKMTVLENGVLIKSGEIKKCNGYTSNNLITSSSALNTCGTLKDNLLILNDDDAISYSTALQKEAKVGRYGKFKIERLPGINLLASYPCTAYDFIFETLMHVWSESDGTTSYVKYIVVDARDNTVIQPETIAWVGGSNPRVVTSAAMDYFLIVFSDSAGVFDLRAVGIAKNELSTPYSVLLATGTNYTNLGFSLFAYESAYCSWSSGPVPAAANTQIAVFSQTLAGFIAGAPTPITLAGVSSAYGSAILNFGSNIFFAFNSSTEIKTVVYNNTLTSVISAVRTAMTRTGAQTFTGVVLGDFNGDMSIWTTTLTSVALVDLPIIEQAIVTGTSTVTPKRTFCRGAGLAGSVLKFDESGDTKMYLPIKAMQQYDSTVAAGYQGVYTLYLLEYYNENYPNDNIPPNQYVAAKFYDLNANALYTTSGHPDFIQFTPGIYQNTDVYFGLVNEYAGNSSLCIIGKTMKPVMAELANNLHVTGGYLAMYDGAEFAEHNFFQYPLQVALTNLGAGSIGAGTYYYCATYVWQDASGQIHESAPSNPIQITLSVSSQVKVDVATLKLTNKKSDTYITIYRSNDGVLFYKLAGGIGSLLRNRKTVNTISHTDNTSQANIISNPLLYTVGGELANSSAPACSYVATYKRRLIVAPTEDMNSFWFSKDIIPGIAGAIGTPVNFASEFVKSVNERGGPLTGLVQLDDKLLIFKKDTISVMTGEGPANNGLQDDFTTPQIIVSDTGCLYGRSLVIMPLGVMFQSPKGFYLCDRSISVSYIGAPAESFNNSECNSANLMYDRNEVWFGLTGSDTLVFNYYFNQWSNIKWGTTHACIHKNLYLGIISFAVQIETPTVYTRAGSGYSMKMTTGWLSFAQVQGFQRVYKLLLLGAYKSTHRLQVQVALDFDDTVVQTSTITASTNTPPYEWRVFMTRQKCTAIKFTIQDLQPLSGSWTESYALSNMALEVGIKKGLNKRPAANSVG